MSSPLTALMRPAARVPAHLRRARGATFLTFAIAGVMFGAWAPRIPEVKHHLHLSAGSLAVALLAPSIGSLLSLGFSGHLSARLGSARATRLLSIYFIASSWLPGFAPNLPTLWILLFLWGIGIGSMDVAMNAQAVTVEKAYRRPVMSAFHASWSLGSLFGAVIGTLGAAFDVPIALQQGVTAAVLLVVLVVIGPSFLPDPVGEPDEVASVPSRNIFKVLDVRLLLLGVAAMTAMLSEGSVGDWSGILLRDDLHAQAAHVGFAYGAFMAMQTLGRMVGDRVVEHFGRLQSIVTVCAIGAVGLAAGLATHTVVGAVIGFALLGIGLSIMVPVAFSAAADGRAHAGPAIAAVSSLAYTAFLAGPTMIGLVAQATSVPTALWLVPFVTAAGGVVATLAIRRPTPHEQRSAS